MNSKLADAIVDGALSVIASVAAYLTLWIVLPLHLAIAFTVVVFIIERASATLMESQRAIAKWVLDVMEMDAMANRRSMQAFYDARHADREYRHDWNAVDEEILGVRRAKADLEHKLTPDFTWDIMGFILSIAIVVGMAFLGTWIQPMVRPIIGL
ncbi:hypothetical protein [Pelagibacterium sp.]|uniref:hypothetical protein n=1 Tax=Pelagibacterium sp. TaxID=1967288 RepID=UPI003BAD7302